MGNAGADPALGSREEARQWTLIRGARQLLTLRGSSGPRCGPAMSDLNIIPDGALLIRDGVIEDVGTTRRVENLVPARTAREIDAAGRIVMPAFVDPDVALAAPAVAHNDERHHEADIRRMSWRRLESRAALTAADLARYGVLTAGAHTHSAPDLQNTLKALRLHHMMQSKPLRIRSVFSPPLTAEEDSIRRIGDVWMPAVFRKKLASLVEIPAGADGSPQPGMLAAAAAAAGFNIRFRLGDSCAATCTLAWSAGAIALVGPVPEPGGVTRALADAGCITVLPGTEMLARRSATARHAIDDGTPLALASGYRDDMTASMNPQFLLYLASHAAGMSAEEAIMAATYNAACSLRLSHVTGSLIPGKSADLCVMDVDDYHELARRAGHHDVYLVMRAGKVVHRRSSLIPD